jgi:hypothetical protein
MEVGVIPMQWLEDSCCQSIEVEGAFTSLALGDDEGWLGLGAQIEMFTPITSRRFVLSGGCISQEFS